MLLKNNFKILILVLFLAIFLMPKPAFALGYADIASFFDSIAESSEEAVGPLFATVAKQALSYTTGIFSLLLSTQILENVINLQGDWFSSLNPMTEAGWHFTAGIANMLLVLFFLIIAFAFILKNETFNAKKTLPKLILVAFLLNFSLLFVRMLFDITQIVYNTILNAGGTDLVTTVMGVFLGGGWSILSNIISWIAALLSSFAIPLASSFAQVAFTLVFSTVFLPNIITWTFQTICFFALTAIFGVFIFLFGARVFIISMLAMLAPLAFLCLILPQTQKWWSEWFKNLTEWLILGVFVLFFLVLGFKGLGLLIPEGIGGKSYTTPLPLLSLPQLGQYIFYYFGIFCYMAVILLLAKKYKPAMAETLINFGKEAGGLIWTKGLKPYGRAIKKTTQKAVTDSPRITEWANRQAIVSNPELKGWKKLMAPAVTPAYALRRRIGQSLGPNIIESQKKELADVEKRMEGIKDPTLMTAKFIQAIEKGDTITALGTLNAAAKKGGPFKKNIEKQLEKNPNYVISMAKTANNLKAIPYLEQIARLSMNKNNLDDYDPKNQNNFLKRLGFKEYQDLSQEEKIEWDEKGYKEALDKLIDGIKEDDMKSLNKDFFKSKKATKIAEQFWTGRQWSAAVREYKRDAVNALEDIYKELNKIKQNNDSEGYKRLIWETQGLAGFSQSGVAQQLGVRSFWAFAPERIIKEGYKNIGEVLAEKPIKVKESQKTAHQITSNQFMENPSSSSPPPPSPPPSPPSPSPSSSPPSSPSSPASPPSPPSKTPQQNKKKGK